MIVIGFIAQNNGWAKNNQKISGAKEKLQDQNVRKIFIEQLIVLSDIPIIVILNPEVVDDLQEVGEVEKGEINAITFLPHRILHDPINPKQIKGFDQQIDRNQKSNVDEKFPVQMNSRH